MSRLISDSSTDNQPRHRIRRSRVSIFTRHKGVFVTLTVFPDNNYLIEREWEEGQWYQFTGVNGNIYAGETGIKHRDGASVEETTPPGLKGPTDGSRAINELIPSLYDDTARIDVDIEVLTTVPDSGLDLNNPEHIELLCIGVGFQPEHPYPPITDVLFRPEDGPAGECQLLESFCTWLDEHPGQTLLTYRGEQFDVPHLRDRARIAAEKVAASDPEPRYEELEERVTDALESYTHVDLGETAFKSYRLSPRPQGATQRPTGVSSVNETLRVSFAPQNAKRSEDAVGQRYSRTQWKHITK